MILIKRSILCLFICWFLVINVCCADSDLISLFPLDKYDQTLSNWIKPTDPNYDKPLLDESTQQQRFNILYSHYFGDLSPWSADYIRKLLQSDSPDNVKTIEKEILANFNNQNKPDNVIGYGVNYHPYDEKWIKGLETTINLAQFDSITYADSNRAIAINNLTARGLPTNDPYFYSHKLAGQGYPFDNLQVSAVFAGTPLYILGETNDKAWSLVVTPDFIAWVQSQGIARVTQQFITTWTTAAKKNLSAITKTQTPITSKINGDTQFLFYAYVGAIFPAEKNSNGLTLLIPSINKSGYATIKYATVDKEQATLIPITLTRHNLSTLMQTLIGRPYGWGGMYFYNDCSAELKSLFVPFGIWLPRHSSDQVTVGKMVDMTASTPEKRLAYLTENGVPFLTVVYIGGHVFLYLGNYTDPINQNTVALTYQNMWGLRPPTSTYRKVVGKAVLLPLLLQYPEDLELRSQAATSTFQVAYLNQFPLLYMQGKPVDLKSLMFSEYKQ